MLELQGDVYKVDIFMDNGQTYRLYTDADGLEKLISAGEIHEPFDPGRANPYFSYKDPYNDDPSEGEWAIVLFIRHISCIEYGVNVINKDEEKDIQSVNLVLRP